jgi:transcription initiation factor IIE alpha subunit
MTALEVIKILQVIKRGTTKEIAVALNQPMSTVKSALKTLRNNQQVEFETYRLNKHGSTTYFWSLKNA